MFREWLLLLRHVDLKIYYAVLTGVHAQDDTAHAFEVLLELIQFERDVTVVVAVSSAGVGSGVVTQFEVEVSLFLLSGSICVKSCCTSRNLCFERSEALNPIPTLSQLAFMLLPK